MNAFCETEKFHDASLEFMLADLKRSGLTPEDFPIPPEPLPLHNFKPAYRLWVTTGWGKLRIKDGDPKYINPKGVSVPVAFLGNFTEAKLSATVEGYKKAVKFFKETGIPTICIDSCWGFGESLLEAGDEVRSLHTEILDNLTPGSQHLVFMDGDWKTNEDVNKALSTYAILLDEIGVKHSCRNLPSKGVDDYLEEKYGMKGPDAEAVALALLKDAPEIPTNKLINGAKTFVRSTDKRFNADYLDLTDRGVGSRLTKTLGKGNLLYIPELDNFAFWNGSRWRNLGKMPVELFAPVTRYLEDRGAALLKLGYELARAGKEAKDEGMIAKGTAKVEEGKEHLKWAKRCSSTLGAGAIFKWVASREDVKARLASFDSNPDILGVANGVVCLKTGELRAEVKEDRMLRHCPTRYVSEHSGQSVEKVKKFLSDVTSLQHGVPAPNRLEYLRRRLGAALRGRNSTSSLEIWFGPGSNGKSVLAKAIQSALGLTQAGGYAAICNPAILLSAAKPRDAESSTPTLTSLVGSRIVFMSETKDTDHLNEQMVKAMTGGDGFTTRGNYKDPTTVDATFTPILLTNPLPHIAEGGAALWDRLAPLPLRCRWQRQDRLEFDPEEAGLPPADLWFRDEMHESVEALEFLLWWLIQGGVSWQICGIGEVPADIREVFNQYKSEEDKLADWATERGWVFNTGYETVDSELYSDHVEWCRNNGGSAPAKKTFLKRMRERWKSLVKRESNGKSYYRGIGKPTTQRVAGNKPVAEEA